MSYLFDTYAIIEWFLKENKNYEKYFIDIYKSEGFVTKFTLLELYHLVYHKEGQEKADFITELIVNNMTVTKATLDIIKDSGIFRSKMLKEKKKLSYTDCINYVTAMKLGVKLLTGDKGFKDIKNVEYVK